MVKDECERRRFALDNALGLPDADETLLINLEYTLSKAYERGDTAAFRPVLADVYEATLDGQSGLTKNTMMQDIPPRGLTVKLFDVGAQVTGKTVVVTGKRLFALKQGDSNLEQGQTFTNVYA